MHINAVFDMTAKMWDLEEFTKFCYDNCFIKTGKIYILTGGARGFCYKGRFVTALHAVGNKNIILEGKQMKMSQKITELDAAVFGSPDFVFATADIGKVASLRTEDGVFQGRVITSDPIRVFFSDNGPMHGLSGSPLVSNGEVVSIYSTHHVVDKGFISGPKMKTWIDSCVEKVVSSDQVLELVIPCGRGKSTALVKGFLQKFKRIVVIEPRVFITSNLANFMNARCFSGEDEIDFSDGINYITHGKFVSMLTSGNLSPLNMVDLIIVDESHDASALTSTCKRFTESEFSDIKSVWLTATLGNFGMCIKGIEQSKFQISFDADFAKEQLNEIEIIRAIKKYNGVSIAIQVPTVSYGNRLTMRIKERPVLFINRPSVDSGQASQEAIIDFINKNRNGILLTTNVSNFGVTLPIDVIIIEGTNIEVSVEPFSSNQIHSRNLTIQERVQWIGRVGRTKPGIVCGSRLSSLKVNGIHLSDEEKRLEAVYGLLAGLDFENEYIDEYCKYTRPRLLSALMLGATIDFSLGMVDDRGRVYVNDQAAINFCVKKGLSYVKGPRGGTTYNVGRSFANGPDSGHDPTFDKEWLKSVFGDVPGIKTGFGFLWFPVLSFPAYSIIGKYTPVVSTKYIVVNTSNVIRRAPQVPKIESFDVNVFESDSFHKLETDNLELLSDLPDCIIDVIDSVSDAIGANVVSYGVAKVKSSFRHRNRAVTLSYFLDSRGIDKLVDIRENSDEYIFDDVKVEEMIVAGGLTAECVEVILGKPDIIQTSFGSLLALVLPSAFGVLNGIAIFAVIGYIVMNKVRPVTVTVTARVRVRRLG